MAQVNVNIRMDEGVKQQFEWLCGELGLNMTTAFNMFAKTMIRQKGIPFEISLNYPNPETQKTIDNVDSGRNLSRTFDTVEELMADLNA